MIKIISKPISKPEFDGFLGKPFIDMIKFVVDVEKGIIALGGELHSDAETLLLESGSRQTNLWGGNIYPAKEGIERLEYTSMINIRPSDGNRSLEVTSPQTKEKMMAVIRKLVP